MLEGKRILVLDLETAKSADDCVYCGQDEASHDPLTGGLLCKIGSGQLGATFTKIGWNNKPALGLSIGCSYPYVSQRPTFFDPHSLEEYITHCVETQPLLVSFNGIGFDFPLMRGLLRRRAEIMSDRGGAERLMQLCDDFKILCTSSYDILAEIWEADPSRKFERGLNSLDTIAKANGLGSKLSHGAQAPRDWRDGQYAKVINYCADDVYKTKALFEMIVQRGSVLRGDGQPIILPSPPVAHL